jgi:hypothetical protein
MNKFKKSGIYKKKYLENPNVYVTLQAVKKEK